MRFFRILITLFLLIILAACSPQTAPDEPSEAQLTAVGQEESTADPDLSLSEDAGNLVRQYGLEEIDRIVLSELHLASGEEQSSYQQIVVLEDPAEVSRLVNSLDQTLESVAAARCPAKGLLGFYTGEELTAEFGLGCELDDIFFLSDLKNGRHYRPSAELLEDLKKILAISRAE